MQGFRAFGAVFLQNQPMEPRPSPDCQAQGDLRLHKKRLTKLLKHRPPMVRLDREIDWQGFDEYFGTYYSGGRVVPRLPRG